MLPAKNSKIDIILITFDKDLQILRYIFVIGLRKESLKTTKIKHSFYTIGYN